MSDERVSGATQTKSEPNGHPVAEPAALRWLRRSNGTRGGGRPRRRSNRIPIFALQLVYVAILAYLGWAYQANQKPEWLASVPDPVGSVPIGAIWFGALGGVLISLAGITEHRYTWDNAYWTWHVTRPAVGAAVAVVAVLIIEAGILATGMDLTARDNGPRNTFYYLVAFVAGYREATFRSMLKRLADVILTSDETAAAPRVIRIEPNHGSASGGDEVKITGSGLLSTEVVRFGTTESPTVRVASDSRVIAILPPGTAGGIVDVTVGASKGSSTLTDAFTYDP